MLTLSAVECVDVANVPTGATLAWVFKDKKEQKRQQHRHDMVQFRRKRKAKQEGLQQECRRLENHVKLVAASVRAAAARTSTRHDRANCTSDTLRELLVEIEDLRRQNVALTKEIKTHNDYQQVLLEAAQYLGQQGDNYILPSIDLRSGWRVYFPGGEPSFHFHPYDRSTLDAMVESCTAALVARPPTLSLVGELLGWNVLHATVSSAAEGHALVAKSRFTKRIRCPLLVADEVMSKEDRNSWPLIVTPMKWGGVTSRCASNQVLQQFDDNTYVLLHNIQCNINLRYISLVGRHRCTERERKRVITHTMMIADSEENKRSRSAEANEDEVQWVTEGGANLTIIEVDDTSIDVVYDHWGGCESALHAQYLFVQWAHYALRWEQMVVPSKLLPA